MRVKMILPALIEARSRFFRPLKYSLFPPLGLATLAGYLGDDDEVEIVDEHVQPLRLDDEPDLVVIEAYVTSAHRAYGIADHYRRRGAHVCLGGLHVSARPEEAQRHADTVFIGPGEDTWPTFLDDFRRKLPRSRYGSAIRTLEGAPWPRRDLIQRHRYLVPNSIVVSRGCPHRCEFCYTDSFYRGGRRFYTMAADQALAQINALPGRHVFFLDDNIFGDPRFARTLFEGMRGMGRLWQGAATVQAVLTSKLLTPAVESGLRSLFFGFETLNAANLRRLNKGHNHRQDYDRAVRVLRDRGVMINASFVFGMDDDDEDVFDRTEDWAIEQGIETCTFHILTPYPGTRLYDRMRGEGRMLTSNWDLYDTRHAVFRPARMSPKALEAGYWRAYERFYRWRSILKASGAKQGLGRRLRHVAYTGGWKKLEAFWNVLIKCGCIGRMAPLLEAVLGGSSGAGERKHPPISAQSLGPTDSRGPCDSQTGQAEAQPGHQAA